MIKFAHRSTLFREYFKIPKNFVYVLKKCRNGKSTTTELDLKPFDLESELAKRVLRNDVSFMTTDGRLIILIEHQSTINPNMAFRLFLYYNELLQLWVKLNAINLYGTKKIENFPAPEFYVVYNGTKELKESMSTFKLECEEIKIDIKVKIIDIRFDNLDDTAIENPLAGYAYFYKKYEDNIKIGTSKEKSFTIARTECMKKGYMTGFIEKEDFIMFYKNFLDYGEQLKAEYKEEGKAEQAEETIIYAIESHMPRAFIEGLAKKSNIDKERLNELYRAANVTEVAS